MPHGEILQLDPDERILRTVRRSLIGLIPHFTIAILVFLVFLLAIFAIGRFPDSIAGSMSVGMALVVATGLTFLIELVVYITILVYLRNELVVTTQSLVQHLQTTLFNRKISQLGLTNVEDVSVKQDGILASTFNFGTVIVETAGEQLNFEFKFGRNPYEAAKVIIEAQEDLIKANQAPDNA